MRRCTTVPVSVDVEVDSFLSELPFEDALDWYERDLTEKYLIERVCRRYNLVPGDDE
jgi:hypothetical protein